MKPIKPAKTPEAKLFEKVPKSVQKLSKAASKTLRAQARAEWWAENNPQ